MEHRRTHAAVNRTLRNVAAILLFTLAGLTPIGSSAGPNDVPPPYQGTWVPSKATCESPVRVLITADRLTLQNGQDTEAIGGIEMAGPGYFAHDYRGIMAVLLTEFSGDQPAMVTFNLGEKRGVAQVDFAQVVSGKANAQMAKYNAHISKLGLAKRFPLDKAQLKKCPAGSGAAGK